MILNISILRCITNCIISYNIMLNYNIPHEHAVGPCSSQYVHSQAMVRTSVIRKGGDTVGNPHRAQFF